MNQTRKKKIGIIHQGEKKPESFIPANSIFLFLNNNFTDKYEPVDIFINENNDWFLNGVPILPSDLMHRVDLVWNTANPAVSSILNNFSIKNISPTVFSSSLKQSKEMFREHMQNTEVYISNHFIIPAYQNDIDGPIEKFAIKKAKLVFEKFSSPWIVKSFNEDIGMGIHVAKTYPKLVNAIIDGAEHGNSLLVEELIAGIDGSVHSLKGFRNEDIYTFGSNNFSLNEKEKLANITRDLHEYLGNNHYFKFDYILNPRGKIYLQNIDLIPDLKDNSNFCESCMSVGIKPANVIEHILEQ